MTVPWSCSPASCPGRGGRGADYARLIRRDGSEVARWSLKALKPTSTDIVHGILAEPDGTLTLSLYERTLAQVDRCGAPSFQLEGPFHHDLTRAESGGYWALGANLLPRWEATEAYLWPHASDFFRSKTEAEIETEDLGHTHIRDDTIVRLDEQGRRLLEFSLHKVLYEGGLGHLLGMRDIGRERLTHSNSIQELPTGMAPAFPMFAAGDLLLSLRLVNTLLVMDPATRRIKWHQTGPWYHQHDARFQPDGTITLFNNRYLSYLGTPNPSLRSNILRVDPATGEVSVVMGSEISEGAGFYTSARGQHQMLPSGDVLVVQAEGGRVVQFSPQGEILWEYINRYDEGQVAQIVNAYVYPAGYFQVDDWSCPPR